MRSETSALISSQGGNLTITQSILEGEISVLGDGTLALGGGNCGGSTECAGVSVEECADDNGCFIRCEEFNGEFCLHTSSLGPSVTLQPSVIPFLSPLQTLSAGPSTSILPSVIDSAAQPFFETPPVFSANSTQCPSDPDVLGFNTIDAIQNAITGGFQNVVLCPETDYFGTLELSDDIYQNVTVVCGGVNCRFTATSHHLILRGEMNVRVEGVTFHNALDQSVTIIYGGAKPDIVFSNCTFTENGGTSVLSISSQEGARSVDGFLLRGQNHHTSRKRPHVSSSGRALEDESARLSVVLDGCAFIFNIVQRAMIEVRDGTALQIRRSVVFSNTAEGSILDGEGAGRVVLSSTRFEENTFNSQSGMIQIDFGSLIVDSDTCGLYNFQSSGFCGGIYSNGLCRQLSRCDIPCVDTLEDLRTSFIVINNLPPIVEVCAGTTLSLAGSNDPIEISLDGAELRCGPSGSIQDDCIIDGGQDQMVIKAGGVQISGFSFIASSRASIKAQGQQSTKLTVRSCQFSVHTGSAAILVAHEDVDTSAGLDQLSTNNIQSMSLLLETCLIFDNTVTLAPVVNIGGVVSVNDCVFQENSGQAGALVSVSESVVSLFSSCYLGNTGITSTISLGQSTSLVRNDDNFGIGNDAGLCEDLNHEDLGCLKLSSRFCTSTIEIPHNVFATYTPCIADYSGLSEALSDGSSATNIQLCPGSTIDMVGRDPLQITINNTTVLCGQDGSRLNLCGLNGGENQIIINENVRRAVARGITFSRSTQTSVMVTGRTPLSLEFVDCSWEACTGDSSVQISSEDSITEPPTSSPTIPAQLSDDIFTATGADFFENRRLEDDGAPAALVVYFNQCSFSENEVGLSLLRNFGAVLNLTSCSFESNIVGRSLISSDKGRLLIVNSCFHENRIDGSGQLAQSDEVSDLSLESNFQSSNEFPSQSADSVCSGLFDSSTNLCHQFDATTCQAHLASSCFADWESLVASVEIARSLDDGVTFTICEDTTLFADNLAAVELTVDTSVIQCGPNGASRSRCVVSGGRVQFRISGNTTGIEFRGITFISSTVAAIHAAGGSNSDAAFVDCIFAGHTGVAAVANYGGDVQALQVRRSLLRSSRFLQESLEVDRGELSTGSMALTIDRSIFTQNVVSYAPLSVLGGQIDVQNTVFLQNVGTFTAVGVWLGGSAALHSSCFAAESTEISIFLGDGSTFTSSSDVFGEAFPSTEADCVSGAFNGSHCFPIDESSCPIDLESIEVIAPAEGCFDNWSDFAKAVTSDSVRARKSITFILCENAVLDASSGTTESLAPIVVNGPDVTIQCGSNGSRSGNCKVIGGEAHFKLEGEGRSTFLGVAFSGATAVSVLATGESSAVAVFHDCVWEENLGKAVLLIHKEAQGEDVLSIENFGALPQSDPGSAMTVSIDMSSFRANQPSFAVIANNGGVLNVMETLLWQNTGTRLGVLAAFNGAQVGVSFICINGNDAEVRGLIYIGNESSLTFNRNTFAVGNEVEQDSCGGIYFETSGSCLNSQTCQGRCEGFEIRTCPLGDFAPNETLSPTVSPTHVESIRPTNGTTENVTLQHSGDGGIDLGLIVGLGVGLPLFLCCCLPAAFILVNKVIHRGSGAVKPVEISNLQEEQKPENDLSEDLDSSDNVISQGKSTDSTGSLGDIDDGLLDPLSERDASIEDDPLAELGSVTLLHNDSDDYKSGPSVLSENS